MRTRFLIFLFIITQHLHATDVPPSGWIRAPMVKILADNSSEEVKEGGIDAPVIGHPAFQTLKIRKEREGKWIVSGTVCSTNAGRMSNVGNFWSRKPQTKEGNSSDPGK